MEKPGYGPRGGPSRASRAERARLLSRVSRRGDTAAARRLVELYRERLYGLAFRVLAERQAAEDVVQDVFLCLLEGKASYRGAGHPDAFLLRVTSFLAIDRARAGIVRKRKELAAVERSPASSSRLSSLDKVLREELEVEIGALLEELPPETRAALALRFWEGATVREIARILSSTKSSVARRIDSALEKLRRPLLVKGFGAAVVTSVLGDLLNGMEVTPSSAGFRSALVKTISTGGSGLSAATLPAVPDAAGTISAARAAVTVAAALVAAIVIYSSIPPEAPPAGQRPLADAGVVDGGRAPGAGGAGSREAGAGANAAVGDEQGRSTITGTVVAPDGRPARGAVVRIFEGEGRQPPGYAEALALTIGPLAGTTTRRDGAFTLAVPWKSSYRVVALAPGSAPGTSGLLRLAGGQVLKDLTIRLAAGEVVEGVASFESGSPAGGVRVTAFLPVVMGTRRVGFWPYETTSGRDGSFRIPGVSSFAAELLVESERHAVLEAPEHARQREQLEIVVAEGATISGDVVDADGAAVAGAEVLAFTSLTGRGDAAVIGGSWILARRTVSDASGRFALRALVDDRHVLFARRSGHALSEPLPADVSSESSHAVEARLFLRAAGRIDGRFVSGGEPFGPAKGIAIPAPGAPGERGAVPAVFMMSRYALIPATEHVGAVTFDVGAAGEFTAPGLEPREYLLLAYQESLPLLQMLSAGVPREGEEMARPPTYRPGQRDVEVEILDAPPSVLLSGQVVDETGGGIANASAEFSFFGRQGGRTSVTVWADQLGVFQVESMPPRSCDRVDVRAITADGRTGRLDPIPLEEASRLESLRVVIETGPEIAGTLVSGSGEPITDALVTLRQDGHDPWPTAVDRQTSPDQRGRFSFSAVEKDRAYHLVVESGGRARVDIRKLEIGTLDLRVVLRPESVIRGRVVDLDGQPAAIAGMSLSRHEGSGVSSFASNVDLEGEGRFVLRGLEAGEYSLSAFGTPGDGGRQPVTRRSERITVGEGETVEGVVLTMTELVAIDGQVIDAVSGAPVAGATVADWDPTSRHFPRGRTRVNTSRDGRFRMAGFQRGTIRIHAVAEGYLKVEQNVEVSGEADADALLKLIPARTLEVSVVEPDGAPVEGARVISGFEWPKQTATDRAGVADVVVPAAALGDLDDRLRRKAWVSVHKDDYKEIRLEWEDALPREPLEVILIRGGGISGQAVDHTGAPVDGVQITAYRDRQGHGTRSDAGGRYAISGLEPGDYEVRLTSDSVPLPTLTGSATVAAGRDARLDFTLPDPATFDFHAVRIVATLEDGRPAAGFSLLLNEGWAGSGRERRSVRPLACFENNHELATGADGTLEILFEESSVDGVYVSGRREVEGELYRVAESRCPVIDGMAAVVYARLPRGEVTLRAHDARTGEALSDYRYSLVTKGHGGPGSRCRELDGTVRSKVAAGEVTVKVEAEGYEPFEQEVLLEDHGEVTVEARLARG